MMISNDRSQKIVYLIRHGQSTHNAGPVFQAPDAPLSDKGIRQAETTAQRLKHLEFQALLASPLPRAKQTAEHIAQATGKEAEFNGLFVERVKSSRIDGQPWSDPECEQIYKAWHESLFTPGKHVADGENYDDLIARADKAIRHLAGRPEESLVVVTHGFFLTTLVARSIAGSELTPALLRNFQLNTMLENTSITTLRYVHDYHDSKHAWRLWTFNDLAHFAE